MRKSHWSIIAVLVVATGALAFVFSEKGNTDDLLDPPLFVQDSRYCGFDVGNWRSDAALSLLDEGDCRNVVTVLDYLEDHDSYSWTNEKSDWTFEATPEATLTSPDTNCRLLLVVAARARRSERAEISVCETLDRVWVIVDHH